MAYLMPLKDITQSLDSNETLKKKTNIKAIFFNILNVSAIANTGTLTMVAKKELIKLIKDYCHQQVTFEEISLHHTSRRFILKRSN